MQSRVAQQTAQQQHLLMQLQSKKYNQSNP